MMNEQEKELLFKDLSSRLPHGVCCRTPYSTRATLESICNNGHNIIDCTFVGDDNEHFIESIKPYLRPMLSMTEAEKEEYRNIDNKSYSCPLAYAHIPASERIDWLNAHHFDYMGLIDKGLALEAPEGMYNQ